MNSVKHLFWSVHSFLCEVGVVVHVSFKDLFEWSKQPHKAFSFDHSSYELRLGNYIGCSWCVFEKCDLSKIVTFFVLLDLLRRCTCSQWFCSHSLTLNDDIEPIAVLGIPLSDHIRSCFKALFLDHVGNLGSLVVVKTLQDWHCLKESFIPISFCLSSIFHDVIESHTIKLPK